jgi:hypothetical protein
MKYFLQLITFTIGTAVFLLVWFGLEKALAGVFVNALLLDAVSFTIGLFSGWIVDAILGKYLIAKFK